MPTRSLVSSFAFALIVVAAGCSLINAPDEVRPGDGEGGAGGGSGGWGATSSNASSSSASASSSSASSSSASSSSASASSSSSSGGGPVCGNGQVEAGETCDGNCPASCDDGQACTLDILSGSSGACNAACSNTQINVCTGGDGCCPAGCAAPQDTDCCSNPGGGSLSTEDGTGMGVYYCYEPGDSAQVRALKACEAHFGVGTCCVITGGYQDMQYGKCDLGGGATSIHWHWDNHPVNHCDPLYVVGDVVAPGWCGTIKGNFLD